MLKHMYSDDMYWFSAQQLAMLGEVRAIEFPRTERNSRDKARKLGWKEQSVPCKGGKQGYMAKFQPPADVLEVIQSYLKENPDFFTKAKVEVKDRLYSKPYPVSKATVLKIKSLKPVISTEAFDADLFIYISITVQKMLEKTGKELDQSKRNKLILLIYEYCKLKGKCDDEIISQFINVAG